MTTVRDALAETACELALAVSEHIAPTDDVLPLLRGVVRLRLEFDDDEHDPRGIPSPSFYPELVEAESDEEAIALLAMGLGAAVVLASSHGDEVAIRVSCLLRDATRTDVLAHLDSAGDLIVDRLVHGRDGDRPYRAQLAELVAATV